MNQATLGSLFSAAALVVVALIALRGTRGRIRVEEGSQLARNLQTDNVELRRRIGELEQHVQDQGDRITEQNRTIRLQEWRVGQLERLLRTNGIPVPGAEVGS